MTKPHCLNLRDQALQEVRQAVMAGNFDLAKARLQFASEQQQRAEQTLRVRREA